MVVWDATRDFDKMSETKLPEGLGSARTIIPQKLEQTNGADNNLIVGTTRNCIVEGSVQRQRFNLVVWGHFGQVKAVNPHPDDLAFVSAGRIDKTVAKWRKQKVYTYVYNNKSVIGANKYIFAWSDNSFKCII